MTKWVVLIWEKKYKFFVSIFNSKIAVVVTFFLMMINRTLFSSIVEVDFAFAIRFFCASGLFQLMQGGILVCHKVRNSPIIVSLFMFQ